MEPDLTSARLVVDRRQLFTRGAGLLAASGGFAAFLAACGDDDGNETEALNETSAGQPSEEGQPIVGDVLDFALRSDDWEGAFGFVTMRLHAGVSDGEQVWFIRTDASDQAFAQRQKLVPTPKLAVLDDPQLSGELFTFDDGPAVLSSRPGRSDYTPAWRVRNVRWRRQPKRLLSVADVRFAEGRGELTIEDTGAVMNAAVVKWTGGQIGVDRRLRAYLEGGQLIEPPDTRSGEVTFKLHECFPSARYIVTDHSIAPAAEMTSTTFAPRLHAAPRAVGATGRTNVFMNGIEGPGPMEAQPSVFDSDPGDAIWSPYWDHFTYAWSGDARVRVLRTERQVHAARSAGELEEFPGTPDTKGEVFTVNCPVPVTAPATFHA